MIVLTPTNRRLTKGIAPMDFNSMLSELQAVIGERLVVTVSEDRDQADAVSLVIGVLRKAPTIDTEHGQSVVFELTDNIDGSEQRVGGFMLPEQRFQDAWFAGQVLLIDIAGCRLSVAGARKAGS